MLRGSMPLSAVMMAATPALSQNAVIDPDVFSNMQQFTGAPYYAREGRLSRDHQPRHWPFRADEGKVLCLTVDGIALAMFEAEDGDDPFMLGENMVMTFIGSLVSDARDYLRDDIAPADLVEDLEQIYQAALVRCGPPYAQ